VTVCALYKSATFLFAAFAECAVAPDSPVTFCISAPWPDIPFLDHALLFAAMKAYFLDPDAHRGLRNGQRVVRPLHPIGAPPAACFAILDSLFDLKFYLPRIALYGRRPFARVPVYAANATVFGSNIQFGTIVWANLHSETALRFIVGSSGQARSPSCARSRPLRGYGSSCGRWRMRRISMRSRRRPSASMRGWRVHRDVPLLLRDITGTGRSSRASSGRPSGRIWRARGKRPKK
jgi:hypothetical protein